MERTLYKIGIVYYSKTDVTSAMAEAIGSGVDEVNGVEKSLYRICESDIREGRYSNLKVIHALGKCDAIIMGTPTYMGGPSAQFKSFLDATGELWTEQSWANKIAAGFTSGSALNGDQSSTLQSLNTFACQHGMLWAGVDSACGYSDKGVNRLGCQLGATAYAPEGKADQQDLLTAKYLGLRVAKFVKNKTNNTPRAELLF